ncbi:hypothetical protein LMG28690_03912 [Paraburkholderia caffeinilytica]|nr:hypothetical protein LMG28690_03912 [Paraburkholderia caffeinilytica]
MTKQTRAAHSLRQSEGAWSHHHSQIRHQSVSKADIHGRPTCSYADVRFAELRPLESAPVTILHGRLPHSGGTRNVAADLDHDKNRNMHRLHVPVGLKRPMCKDMLQNRLSLLSRVPPRTMRRVQKYDCGVLQKYCSRPKLCPFHVCGNSSCRSHVAFRAESCFRLLTCAGLSLPSGLQNSSAQLASSFFKKFL